MTVRFLALADDFRRYEEWLLSHPHATLWQSLAWKRYQETLGRETRLYVAEENGTIGCSALVIIDRTAFGLSTWDIPRGPIGSQGMESELLSHIIADTKKDRCIALYVSPLHHSRSDDSGIVATAWRASQRHEQPSATRIIDLSLSDEQILAEMHPKGRYNIHVAEKHGVHVEESSDVAAFHHLLEETAGRDGFTAGPKKRYDMFLRELPGAFLLLAHTPATAIQESPLRAPIAGLMGVISPYGSGNWQLASSNWHNENATTASATSHKPQATSYYYYGASDYAHRALMAPYLLQWEAMKLCRARGARFYDLLGIAPAEAGPAHPWAAISAFKAKFGGRVIEYPPEQEIVLRPFSKALLRVKRRILG